MAKKPKPTLYLAITLCLAVMTFYIGLKCGQVARKYPEPFKVPSIIDVQTGLVDAGYDIGKHGIDGRLADCNTVQAWKLYQIDVLFNEYAAVFMTADGSPRKDK